MKDKIVLKDSRTRKHLKSKGQFVILLSFLLIFTLSCSFFTRLLPDKQTLSTVPPELPRPPKPTAPIKGTPEEQAVYFANQLASSETRLAGWLGLYDALGIPVINQDGAPVGSTGDDPIGPRYWQIWYASGLDKAGRGIPLSDAGRLLMEGSPEFDSRMMGSILLNDLRLASKSNDPQARLMAMFVRERIKRWPSHLDLQDVNTTPEKAVIDLPTIQLLMWVVTRSVLFQTAATSGKTATVTSQPATFQTVMFQNPAPTNLGSQVPCSEKWGNSDATYWIDWLMNKAGGGGVQLPGMTKAFKGILEGLQEAGGELEDGIEKTSKVITWLNVATALISLLLQLAAMEINPTQDPDPLERTKTTNRGKDGKIVLQLYSAPENIPDGNKERACMLAFATNALGISFSFPPKGPIPGAEIMVEGGIGFPDLVLFNSEGTNSMRRWTAKDGSVEYKIFGAPQKRNLPETAKPVDKEFSIHVKAQPEEAGLNSMLNIFFHGLTFGAKPSGAGGLEAAIDIAKGFKYDMGEYVFRLTDWKSPGYRATGKTADVTYSGVICSLEKPFKVSGSIINYSFNFTPSSATTGIVTIKAAGMMVTSDGGGTYKIEGADTDKPRIAVMATAVGHSPVGSRTGSGMLYIDLIPLETNECSDL